MWLSGQRPDSARLPIFAFMPDYGKRISLFRVILCNHRVNFTMKRLLVIIILLPAIALSASKMHESGVDWQDWSALAFEQAKQENRMILVNVGMEGCAACYRMDTITYADEDVARLVNKHFVTIAVDSEARPDIGERYMDWAWPATIFLAPDATQVLAIRGNRLPRNFIPILNNLIENHQAGTLEPDPESPYAAAPEPVVPETTSVPPCTITESR